MITDGLINLNETESFHFYNHDKMPCYCILVFPVLEYRNVLVMFDKLDQRNLMSMTKEYINTKEPLLSSKSEITDRSTMPLKQRTVATLKVLQWKRYELWFLGIYIYIIWHDCR